MKRFVILFILCCLFLSKSFSENRVFISSFRSFEPETDVAFLKTELAKYDVAVVGFSSDPSPTFGIIFGEGPILQDGKIVCYTFYYVVMLSIKNSLLPNDSISEYASHMGWVVDYNYVVDNDREMAFAKMAKGIAEFILELRECQ
jgi:hypothetical protein